MDIESLDAASLTGISFECECGMTHTCGMNSLTLGRGVVSGITEICRPYVNMNTDKRLLVVCDNNTYAAAGKRVFELLADRGMDAELFMFDTGIPLVPDERALGALLLRAGDDIGLIVAVGSGVINDLCRLVAARTGRPYVIVATAPSMDGYASNSSPIITDGMKTTWPAVYPVAMLADYEVLEAAPHAMLAAGFGDVIGKYIALADWTLALDSGLPGPDNRLDCAVVRGLVERGVKKCADTADGIKTHETEAVKNLLEALILTGQAMGFIGVTRPASGCEHKFAHFWESGFVRDNLPHDLHGAMVGVGTAVASRVYEIMNRKGIVDLTVPSPGDIDHLLDRAGAKKSPFELAVSRDVFRQSINGALGVSPRKFTILDIVSEKGLCDKISEILTDYYYG